MITEEILISKHAKNGHVFNNIHAATERSYSRKKVGWLEERIVVFCDEYAGFLYCMQNTEKPFTHLESAKKDD